MRNLHNLFHTLIYRFDSPTLWGGVKVYVYVFPHVCIFATPEAYVDKCHSQLSLHASQFSVSSNTPPHASVHVCIYNFEKYILYFSFHDIYHNYTISGF